MFCLLDEKFGVDGNFVFLSWHTMQGKCIEYQVSWMADENSADEDHRQESVLMTWENERCLFPQCGPLVRAFMQNKLVLNGIVYSYKSIQNVDIKVFILLFHQHLFA